MEAVCGYSDTSLSYWTDERKQKTSFSSGYLVFGYYVNQGHNQENKFRDDSLDIELYDLIVDSDSPKM